MGRREQLEFIEVIDLDDHSLGRIPAEAAEIERPPKVGVALRPERVRVSTSLIKDTRDGRIYLDPFKRHAKPYWLNTEPRITPIIVSTLNSQTAPVVMPIDRGGPLEIDYSYFQSTGPFTVQIFDPDGRPMLMNREIHIRTMASGFGSGGLPAPAGRPFIWPEPWFLNTEDKKRNLMMSFRDLSGADNFIRFVLHGRRFYHQNSPASVVQRYERYYQERPLSMPFFYTTEQEARIPALTPVGTEFDFTIRIRDDSDVLFYKMTSATTPLDVPYEFKLIEQSNGRELMTDYVRVENGFGDGELPHILFEPMYFESGTKLTFRVRTLVVPPTGVDHLIWPTFVSSLIIKALKK